MYSLVVVVMNNTTFSSKCGGRLVLMDVMNWWATTYHWMMLGWKTNSGTIIEAEGFLSPPGDKDDPLDHCVVLPVRESQQIEFQPGDVIGYYVDHYKRDEDKDKGGIQWIEGVNDVEVYCRYALQRDDIKSQYAVGGQNPNQCGFQISGNSVSYSLNSPVSRAPVINLSYGKFICT